MAGAKFEQLRADKPGWQCVEPVLSFSSKTCVIMRSEKIIVIGADSKQTVERRFRLAGYDVVNAANRETALELARHQTLDRAILLSQGSLINVTETALTLKDLYPRLKIIVLLQRGNKHSNRFLRQLLGHPIEGSQIMTRRELQRHLRGR